MLSIGLMSGTSMDGIDAALLETDGTPNLLKALGHYSLSYTPEFKLLLKAAEFAIRSANGNLEKAEANFPLALRQYLESELKITEFEAQIQSLATYLQNQTDATEPLQLKTVIAHSTYLHSLAVKKLLTQTGHRAEEIDVIGYHGQTMLHRPTQKISVILGDGQYLADDLAIKVVNDFRAQDVAAGGQGAPFAPLYHQALAVRDHKLPVAVVNCGGIANITIIQDADESGLLAFDTGPGNGLIDRLIRQRTQGREGMDRDGHYGLQGKVCEKTLAALFAKSLMQEGKNYFELSPPKALDIGDMVLIPELETLSLEDACATLEVFTAESIVRSLKLVNIPIPQHWILAGGGWHNPVILRELKSRLGSGIQVMTADEAGWNSQAMEAQIFAYLAVRSLEKKPLSLPGTTRVPAPMTGGELYLPTG